PFDGELGLRLLRQTLVSLASQNIVAFASGGVLLGLVRNGRLLPHDKDLDLMVVGDDWCGSARWQRLEPELAQRGIGCLWLPYTAGISTSLIRQRIAENVLTQNHVPRALPYNREQILDDDFYPEAK
ncbi:MAG: LicD family protein, partial [Lamprobacter sp.]|uniref:LicD family protein n=1 Tax=Lamprobacter sp. TaxID=3100796 RepID=UPI002B257EFA